MRIANASQSQVISNLPAHGWVVKGDRQSRAPFSSSLRNKRIEPQRTRAIGMQAFHIGADPVVAAILAPYAPTTESRAIKGFDAPVAVLRLKGVR